MSPQSLLVIRIVLVLSIALYLFNEWRERRLVRDEREELIRLKAFELVQKVTTVTLAILALAYCLHPGMDAFFPLVALIISALYTELIGKAWFRRRM